MSKTREQFPLSTRKVLKKTIASAGGGVGLIFIFGIIFSGTIIPAIIDNKIPFSYIYMILGGMLGLILLATIPTYLYQRWYFTTYFYELADNFIIIKKGPITPKEITIPYERVQDVYVDQDILDRIFGLYDVHLSSATAASGVSAHIDGLEKSAADGLRNLLLTTVKEKIDRTNGKSGL